MASADEKLAMLEAEMDTLRHRVATLEAELEQARRLTAPYQPTWVVPNACSVCGLKFDGPMGYACTNPRCPSGVSYCGSKIE